MTILAALQEVVTNFPYSQIKQLVYAEMNEANANYMDPFLNAQFPVLLVMPIVPVDTPGKSGALATTFDFDAYLLTKSTNITVDYSSSDIETEVIAPMRLLGRQFMHRLNEHSIVNPETGGIGQTTYIPSYSSMDANLFGVRIRATVPVQESADVCI